MVFQGALAGAEVDVAESSKLVRARSAMRVGIGVKRPSPFCGRVLTIGSVLKYPRKKM
jgi:hypothetical protein